MTTGKRSLWAALGLGFALILSSRPGFAATDVNVAYVTGVVDGLVAQIGKAEGIFERHGLNASLVAVRTGTEMVTAVASGSADFSSPAPVIVFPAIDKGGDLMFLMNNYDLDYSLLAQKSVGIDTKANYPDIVKPLKGKRIGITSRGGLTEFYVKKMLADAGIDMDKEVSLIAVSAGATALGAFKNNQIDAMVTLPPNDVLMKEGVDYDVVVDNKTSKEKIFGLEFLATTVIANGGIVRKSPATAKAFCQAWADTIKFMQTPANRDRVVAHVSKALNLSAEQAGDVFGRYSPNFSTELSETRWDYMKSQRKDVPPWKERVYAPCAEISSR